MLHVIILESSLSDYLFQSMINFPYRLRWTLFEIFQVIHYLGVGLRFLELLLQGVLNVLNARIRMLVEVSHVPV